VVQAEVHAVVLPWYRQFYLRRGDVDWLSDQISPEGYEGGLEAIDGFAYVGTTMYGNPTGVAVRVHDAEPGPPDAEPDRVAEARLGGAGYVAVRSWDPSEEPACVIPLPHGPVHIRAAWYGMAEAADHPDCDLGGGDLSPERLTIDFWP